MKRGVATLGSMILVSALAVAAGSQAAQAAPQTDDRLIVGANGSTLTGASGGGGAAATWLHGLGAGTALGLGAEYQTIANAHWTLGVITGYVTLGTESEARTTLSGDFREGSGDIGGRHFNYLLETVDVSRTLTRHLSVQLEDRQIDVDTSHGNLPKVGLTYVWSPRLQTAFGYARSVSGNIGTELGSARVDIFGAHTNFLAGGAYGQGAPAVFNLQTGLVQPALKLKEAFAGLSKSYSRVNLQLVVDYLKIAATERVTLTLTCTLPLGTSR